MEYLGSKYDDKFEIQILDENNQILYNNILESVNKSDWFKITDINFDVGDSNYDSAVAIDNIKIY